MMAQTSAVSLHRPRRAVAIEPISSGRMSTELAALHAYLARRFQVLLTAHERGCAFVAPYPSVDDRSADEIVVIPFRSGAALFSLGFFTCFASTTMVVRIGDHGVVECSAPDHASPAFAGTAEWLFGIALSGRYREEIWLHSATARYVGGQSYVLSDSDGWQELGLRQEPPALLRPNGHRLTMQDRIYEPY